MRKLAAIVFLGIFLFSLSACGSANASKTSEAARPTRKETQEENITETQSNAITETQSNANESQATEKSSPSVENYTTGQYKVGSDIPAGDYMLIVDRDGSYGYFGVTSDANGDDILFNDSYQYNHIITIIDGEYLELKKCTAFPLAEWRNKNKLDFSKVHILEVGVDIPAGELKLEANEANLGYYAIYEGSRYEDILASDQFKAQTYVTVAEGQILEISRAHLVN